MRMWKAFKTKEEQAVFKKEAKAKDADFRVCMNMTAEQLEKDLHMEKGALSEYSFVTVYTYD